MALRLVCNVTSITDRRTPWSFYFPLSVLRREPRALWRNDCVPFCYWFSNVRYFYISDRTDIISSVSLNRCLIRDVGKQVVQADGLSIQKRSSFGCCLCRMFHLTEFKLHNKILLQADLQATTSQVSNLMILTMELRPGQSEAVISWGPGSYCFGSLQAKSCPLGWC